jgi:hypothetical protein
VAAFFRLSVEGHVFEAEADLLSAERFSYRRKQKKIEGNRTKNRRLATGVRSNLPLPTSRGGAE